MIKIKTITSHLYNIDNLKERLIRDNKNKCGQFSLPSNGDYLGFSVYDVQETVQNPNYRQNQYLISEFKGELNIISLEDKESKEYIKVNIGDRIYKFGISQLNEFLNTNITIPVSIKPWRLQDMINELLFDNLIRIDY